MIPAHRGLVAPSQTAHSVPVYPCILAATSSLAWPLLPSLFADSVPLYSCTSCRIPPPGMAAGSRGIALIEQLHGVEGDQMMIFGLKRLKLR